MLSPRRANPFLGCQRKYKVAECLRIEVTRFKGGFGTPRLHEALNHHESQVAECPAKRDVSKRPELTTLNRRDIIKKLHYLTQTGKQGEPHAEMARRACAAGVRWVQLRIKDRPAEYIWEQATETLTICREFGATLIINDHVEIARDMGADGVHLGKTDMDVTQARKLLGPKKIIGGTANTLEDIKTLTHKGVDYIGLGPFRFTTTKQNLSPVLGVEGYRHILRACRALNIQIPIIAIGGIQPEEVAALLETGIHGVAMASAINYADKPSELIHKILDMSSG